MTIDDIFETYPDAKPRLIRAAAGVLVAQGRSFRDYERLRFERHGDWLVMTGDGRLIVRVSVAALTDRHDA